MSKLLTINHLMCYRPECFNLTAENIIRMKHKDKIIINIMPLLHAWNTLSDLKIEDSLAKLKAADITYVINPIYGADDNYMRKIALAVSQNTPYSMKLDEDCFLNHLTYDYIVENLHILDNPDNLILTPIVTNGIPTTDLFIDNFLDSKTKNEICDVFLKTNIPNIWGCNYSSLNSYTIGAQKWDPKSFYEKVSELPHFYKGIHPVRISELAQDILRDFVINNFSLFWNSTPTGIKVITEPYLCNSIFIIRTDRWREVINRKDLYRDAFDEVTLNLYRHETHKNFCVIEGAFCIHLYYNTINQFNGDFLLKCSEYYKGLTEKFRSLHMT